MPCISPSMLSATISTSHCVQPCSTTTTITSWDLSLIFHYHFLKPPVHPFHCTYTIYGRHCQLCVYGTWQQHVERDSGHKGVPAHFWFFCCTNTTSSKEGYDSPQYQLDIPHLWMPLLTTHTQCTTTTMVMRKQTQQAQRCAYVPAFLFLVFVLTWLTANREGTTIHTHFLTRHRRVWSSPPFSQCSDRHDFLL